MVGPSTRVHQKRLSHHNITTIFKNSLAFRYRVNHSQSAIVCECQTTNILGRATTFTFFPSSSFDRCGMLTAKKNCFLKCFSIRRGREIGLYLDQVVRIYAPRGGGRHPSPSLLHYYTKRLQTDQQRRLVNEGTQRRLVNEGNAVRVLDTSELGGGVSDRSKGEIDR